MRLESEWSEEEGKAAVVVVVEAVREGGVGEEGAEERRLRGNAASLIDGADVGALACLRGVLWMVDSCAG
jgi:hypothetical protein